MKVRPDGTMVPKTPGPSERRSFAAYDPEDGWVAAREGAAIEIDGIRYEVSHWRVCEKTRAVEARVSGPGGEEYLRLEVGDAEA